MTHKFGVGQIVDLLHRPLRAAVAGEYEIRRLMPTAADGNPEDPSYRIKSIAEKHERVVPESELTLVGAEPVFFSPPDHGSIAVASLMEAPTRRGAPDAAPSAAQIAIGRGRVTNTLAASRAKPGPSRPH